MENRWRHQRFSCPFWLRCWAIIQFYKSSIKKHAEISRVNDPPDLRMKWSLLENIDNQKINVITVSFDICRMRGYIGDDQKMWGRNGYVASKCNLILKHFILNDSFFTLLATLSKQFLNMIHVNYWEQNGAFPIVNCFYTLDIRAPARNNSTSCLSFGSSTALHPPTRISICAAGCAL